MLFWHVALLFSGLCTSVLATGFDGSDTAQSSGVITPARTGVPYGYEKLQGCWIGAATKNNPRLKNVDQKISIQGRRIVHSTLASQIEKDPQVLEDTYWKRCKECEGLPKQTTIVMDGMYIIGWKHGYSVLYSPANGDHFGTKNWRYAESLLLGGIFKKKNKKSTAAVE